MKKILLIGLFLAAYTFGIAQEKKQVTLEDVWSRGTFGAKSVYGVNWMKNGQFYTSQKDGKIIQYDIATGKEVAVLFNEKLEFDSYALSSNEDKLLLETESEPIYRRSSKAEYYVYDLKSKNLRKLSEGGKQLYATFSPDGSKVAFVRENNLLLTDLVSNTEKQLTSDGKWNHLIHGGADWVYEEEFAFAQAFAWSPDGKKIAFYTFDESQVKEYNMQVWDGQKAGYPTDYRFKYPKVGEANATVAISVYDLASGQAVKMDIGTEKDIYIPRINWTQNPNLLSIRRMNRLQNKLEILHADATTGKAQVILTETADTYVDLEFTDDLTYLSDGKTFIHSGERTGFKHLYLYDMTGKLIRPITSGEWEVSSLLGIDEKNKLAYFTSPEVAPTERHLYVIGLDGKNKKRLTTESGTHTPNFSRDCKYYLNYYSSATSPARVSVHQAPTGKLLKVLEDNQALRDRMAQYQIQYKEFFNFKTSEGTTLHGWTIKPQSFDPTRKYPVLMFVYGGPGSQTVNNSWEGGNFFWYQTLAQKGYMIVSIDNRGTGARGRSFKHITYKQLGKYEIQDQIEGTKYLATLPHVDKDRIGIWGWSYGGYMSSLGITVGADVFKTAIAVAPVTTWRFYDSIYTERYLQRPQDNAAGYDENSPINHVQKLKGKYLLIHGTGDDNVHFQNAVEMQNALIKANKQFESFYYPNRNHGIYGGNTRLHLYTMMTDFLEKNL
jgi:dipeptidyl-peptidase-4